MKFAFFGYDFSASVLYRLVQAGHEPVAVFSFDTDNLFTFNVDAQVIAKAQGVPFTTVPADDAAIQALADQGCEVLLSCGYPHKIPVPETMYAINIHPTLLPEGKGIMPMPHLILEHPECAGITVHKLTDKFDEGDILYQDKIDVSDEDTVETLSAKIMMRVPGVGEHIFADIESYWKNSVPQGGKGSWWKPYRDDAQCFDWSLDAAALNRRIRAFGRYGMLAEFQGQRWLVRDAQAWTEAHDYKPGTVVAGFSKQVALAISDGYVVLKELYELNQESTA